MSDPPLLLCRTARAVPSIRLLRTKLDVVSGESKTHPGLAVQAPSLLGGRVEEGLTIPLRR